MAKGGQSGKEKQPNILVIWGDDIGQSNLICYTHGLMGYRTPNIDRIAKEGMLFTDSTVNKLHCGAFIGHHRAKRYRTGLRRLAFRNPRRHARQDCDDRGASEEPGLRDRAVWKESPRRLKPHAADQSRLR